MRSSRRSRRKRCHFESLIRPRASGLRRSCGVQSARRRNPCRCCRSSCSICRWRIHGINRIYRRQLRLSRSRPTRGRQVDTRRLRVSRPARPRPARRPFLDHAVQLGRILRATGLRSGRCSLRNPRVNSCIAMSRSSPRVRGCRITRRLFGSGFTRRMRSSGNSSAIRCIHRRIQRSHSGFRLRRLALTRRAAACRFRRGNVTHDLRALGLRPDFGAGGPA